MVVVLKNASIDLLGIGMGSAARRPDPAEEPSWWTFDDVRAALVDAADLWWRSPGGVGAAYATDGPWRQMVREARAGDYDARGGDGTSSDVILRPLPLTAAQVDRRDRISEWLGLIEGEQNRRIVVMAVTQLARGRKRVPWRWIKHQLGIRFGERGLKDRFDKSIGDIAAALNTAEKRM